MLIESCGGLSAKVPVAHIEVERGHVVLAAGAGKLHAAGDPFRGVVPHRLIVVGGSANEGAPGVGDEGNAFDAQVGYGRALRRLCRSQLARATPGSESGRCTITQQRCSWGRRWRAGKKRRSWVRSERLESCS